MTNSHPNEPNFSDLAEGFRLGPYTIERKLGSGGMADVYFAVHEELHRPAAIKVLRPSLAADEANLQRFMQEARAAASLVHPNIVQVYDVGQQDVTLPATTENASSENASAATVNTDSGSATNVCRIRYIAQEYVAGTNLRQYLDQRGPLSVRESLSILLQTLAALKKSSSVGIVHRDIKPENIMLTADGDVKVTDFGLARLLYDDPKLTRAGTTLGTPMYMSPEQLQDGEVDVRSDLYSLGVTLFHVLTGKPPFTGETPLALAMQHVQATPPKVSDLRSDVPKALVRLIDRLLAKKPLDRFGSPDEVLSALRADRADGLAEHWPDQTIPLPDAERPSNSAVPLPATLRLQAQLNRLRDHGNQRWVAITAMSMLALLALSLGGLVAQWRPRSTLFGNSENMYYGVPKQESVRLQYINALLNAKPRNRYLWEAVPYFFPFQENNTNRLYAGKAWLQLARQLRQQGDKEIGEAEEILRKKIIDNNEMDDLLKALAWVEVAYIAAERDEENKVGDALSRAAKLRPDQNSEDDEIFRLCIPQKFRDQFDDPNT